MFLIFLPWSQLLPLFDLFATQGGWNSWSYLCAASIHSAFRDSFLLSHILCRMKHTWISFGASNRFISIGRLRVPNLPLIMRRPNAPSMAILAEDSLYPKNCSLGVEPPLGNSFMTCRVAMGKQGPQGDTLVQDHGLQQ